MRLLTLIFTVFIVILSTAVSVSFKNYLQRTKSSTWILRGVALGDLKEKHPGTSRKVEESPHESTMSTLETSNSRKIILKNGSSNELTHYFPYNRFASCGNLRFIFNFITWL
ncbi:hypothetical protein Y032_0555g3379 [Ancylostoma ceylanicum]|uniref:Uncharacterized protein n=1 Tax=Ancylostoma ceylanicum TaxID=53326 RepID=A0A016WPR8_9BILA|nr:hypothetical protein Y032_0555g3379 [Ancylostoma ceylanicum]